MNGFLHRLAARALGQAAIVPRRSSLFELPPAFGAVELSASGQAADVETPGAPSARSFAPSRAQVPLEGRFDGVARHAPGATDADTGGPVHSASEGPHEPARQPAAPRLAPSVHARGVVATLAQRAVVARPDEAARIPTVIPMETGGPAVEPSADDAAVPTLVATSALPVPPLVRTSAQGSRSTTAPAEPGDAEPVRVTIGRVEVRAVFPAAPAPRPAGRTAPASLPLADYLRARERP